jgi:hypothetical protein
VRAATARARAHLEEQIGVAYPQAGFRRLDRDGHITETQEKRVTVKPT